MNKKNSLPIKWMLGILIILMAIFYGTNQVSTNMAVARGIRCFFTKQIFSILGQFD